MHRKASLILHEKAELAGGFIVEVKVWQLPENSGERPHGLKYSLFFGRSGERIVAYDNEAGKGDHRHMRERQEPYAFQSLERLISDFRRDVTEELTKWKS